MESIESLCFPLVECSEEDIVGISCSDSLDSENILITRQHQGIFLYKVFEKRCTRNWSVPPNIRFSCAAIQEFSSRRYFVSLEDRKSLLSWKKDDEFILQSGTTKTFSREVFAIFESKSLEAVVLVLFNDMSIVICNELLQELAIYQASRDVVNKTLQVEIGHLVPLENGRILLLVFTVDHVLNIFSIFSQPEKTNKYLIKCNGIFSLEEFLELARTEEANFDNEENIFLSSCVSDLESRRLSLLWSNGVWDVFEFDFITLSDTNAIRTNSSKPFKKIFSRNLSIFELSAHFTLPENQHRTPRKKKTSTKETNRMKKVDFQATSFRSSSVVLCGRKKSQPEQCILSIWDSNFGTALEINYIAISDHAHLLKVFCSKDNEYAFIALSNAVVVYPLNARTSPTLASSIGKLSITSSMVKNAVDVLNPPISSIFELESYLSRAFAESPIDEYFSNSNSNSNLFTESIPIESATGQCSNWSRVEASFLRKLSDPQLTPTIAAFNEVWHEIFKRDYQKGKPQKLPFSQSFIEGISRRCLMEKHFTMPLLHLINHGYISSRVLPELVPYILAKNKLKILLATLEHVVDISADDLVNIIHHLSTTNRTLLRNALFKVKNIEVNEDLVLDSFLAFVIVRPISHVFMQRSLRDLPFQDVLILLEYLYRCMKSFSETFDTTKRRSSKVPKPSILEILTWINLLIDTHFIEMILLPDCHSVLNNLMNLVKDQIVVSEKLQSLLCYLEQFKYKKPLSQEESVDYTIELLAL